MNRQLRLLRGIVGIAAAWGLAWGAASATVLAALNLAHLQPYQQPLSEQLMLASVFALNGALVSVVFSGFVARRYRGRSVMDLRLGRFTVAAASVSALLMPFSGTAIRFVFWGHLSMTSQGALIGALTGGIFGAVAAAMTLRVAQRHRLAPAGDAQRLSSNPCVSRIR